MFNLKLKIMIRKILAIDHEGMMFVFDSGDDFMDYLKDHPMDIKSVHVVDVDKDISYNLITYTII